MIIHICDRCGIENKYSEGDSGAMWSYPYCRECVVEWTAVEKVIQSAADDLREVLRDRWVKKQWDGTAEKLKPTILVGDLK